MVFRGDEGWTDDSGVGVLICLDEWISSDVKAFVWILELIFKKSSRLFSPWTFTTVKPEDKLHTPRPPERLLPQIEWVVQFWFINDFRYFLFLTLSISHILALTISLGRSLFAFWFQRTILRRVPSQRPLCLTSEFSLLWSNFFWYDWEIPVSTKRKTFLFLSLMLFYSSLPCSSIYFSSPIHALCLYSLLLLPLIILLLFFSVYFSHRTVALSLRCRYQTIQTTPLFIASTSALSINSMIFFVSANSDGVPVRLASTQTQSE